MKTAPKICYTGRMQEEENEHVEQLAEDVHVLREQMTYTWRRLIYEGAMRGAGFVIGTVLAVAIASWLLGVFGILPGIGETAERLREILDARTGLDSSNG